MKFGKYIKSLSFKTERVTDVDPVKLKAQYNPDRFHLWRRVSASKDPLDMRNSPHVKLLAAYEKRGKKVIKGIRKQDYYKMHILYGKNHDWTVEKIKKFLGLFDEIRIDGEIKEPVQVLSKPLVKNKYNQGWEIYEGHHRVACATYLGWDWIKCEILQAYQT